MFVLSLRNDCLWTFTFSQFKSASFRQWSYHLMLILYSIPKYSLKYDRLIKSLNPLISRTLKIKRASAHRVRIKWISVILNKYEKIYLKLDLWFMLLKEFSSDLSHVKAFENLQGVFKLHSYKNGNFCWKAAKPPCLKIP